MSNRFYAIQIGDIFLTETGAEAGTGCKVEISNLEDLLSTVVGIAIPSADGTPVIQTIPFDKGKTFEIKIGVLTKPVWETLRNFLIDALENDTSFSVTGDGDIGDFEVTAKPFPQKPFTAARFLNERIYDVNLRFITV